MQLLRKARLMDDGTLWIKSDKLAEINRVIVEDGKTFCKTFYQDAQYDNTFQMVMREGHKEMEEAKQLLQSIVAVS